MLRLYQKICKQQLIKGQRPFDKLSHSILKFSWVTHDNSDDEFHRSANGCLVSYLIPYNNVLINPNTFFLKIIFKNIHQKINMLHNFTWFISKHCFAYHTLHCHFCTILEDFICNNQLSFVNNLKEQDNSCCFMN